MGGLGASLAFLLALIASCGDAFLAPYAAVSSPDHKSLQEHGAVSLGNHGVQRNGLSAVFRLRGCFARALAGESWTSRDRTRSWPCIGSLAQRTQRRRLRAFIELLATGVRDPGAPVVEAPCDTPSQVLLLVRAALDHVGGVYGEALTTRASIMAPCPPSWLGEDGDWLLALDSDTLARAQRHGLRTVIRDDATAPPRLRKLAHFIDSIEARLLPPPDTSPEAAATLARRTHTAQEDAATWEQNYEALLVYFESRRRLLPAGGARAPASRHKGSQPPPKGVPLRAWVDEQRWLYKQGLLDDGRAKRLLESGLQLRKRATRQDPPASRAPDVARLRLLGPEGIKEAKVQQVAAVVAAVRQRLAHAPERVVDLGCGVGHLTRALACAFGVEALGLDRDAAVLDTARSSSSLPSPSPAAVLSPPRHPFHFIYPLDTSCEYSF